MESAHPTYIVRDLFDSILSPGQTLEVCATHMGFYSIPDRVSLSLFFLTMQCRPSGYLKHLVKPIRIDCDSAFIRIPPLILGPISFSFQEVITI